jgi:hypothetical protein
MSLISARASDTIGVRKASWGISFSPDYCYRTLNYRSATQWIAEDRNNREIPKFGFTCGVNFNRRITAKWSAEIGLLFSDKGERTKWEKLAWSSNDASFPAESRTVFHYQFISIPLKAYYQVLERKFNVFVFAGVSPDFFIKQRTVLELKDASGNVHRSVATEPWVYSRVHLSGLLGFGISYKLSKRLTLSVEPTFRRSITPVLARVKDKEYLYSLGLNAGLYLRLKDKSR